MHSNFDRLRIAAGAIIAFIGVGVLIFAWLQGFTDLVLVGFGVLFIIVGVVIALADKDSDLATEILAFFNVFR